MSSVPTAPPPKSSAPSFYRWLMIVLGLVILVVVMYRGTESSAPDYPPPTTSGQMHRMIPPFSLTERSGKQITNRDLAGKIWVADFIYTTCPGPCPLVTAEMAKIQQALAGDPHVQLVTFTVDPQTDTPGVLAKYADSYHADPNRWWFLTGQEKPLYDLIQNGFLQAVQDNRGQPAEAGQFTVTHSTSLALVDAGGVMRGVYNSTGGEERATLLHDIAALEKEDGL
jgi:protein SCO1/2